MRETPGDARLAEVRVAAAGLLVVGIVCALVSWPLAARDSTTRALLVVGAGSVAVLVGCAWALRRGGTGFGLLLGLAGCLWLVAAWNDPRVGSAVPFTVALGTWGAFPVVAAQAALTFPGGRLGSGRERIAVITGYVVMVGLLGAGSAVLMDPAAGTCGACPANLLVVRADPVLAGTVFRLGAAAAVPVTLVLAALCGWRIAASSAAARRRSGVILGSAAVLLVAESVIMARAIGPAAAPLDRTTLTLTAVQAISLTVLALGVVLDRVRLRRARSKMARYALDLGRSTAAVDMRGVLAAELDQPDLTLAYPLADGGLVDATGAPTGLGGVGRTTTALAVDGDTLAVLSHRPRLAEDHRLVAEVLSAARLPLDNERLAARARAQVVELTASQLRIIESGDAQRRRLERDLHDGAQQRLVALMLSLRLARATASGADAALIDSAVADLREVVAAVRRVASGIYPAVLGEAGLRGALAALAEDAPHPVRVRAVPADRFPAVAEAVAYRLVSVMAGCGAIEVGIRRRDGSLVVDVDAAGDPGPLTDVEDRTGALGGTLAIERTATGTAVHAELPCE